MKTTVAALMVAAGLTAVAFYSRGWAQTPRPSQHGSVSQQIANTTITIEYNRPVARGRTLFGSLVPYGRVWCPGADTCTTIELSRCWCPGADTCTTIELSSDVKVNGETLAHGTYSIWAEPQPDRWTMIFNSAQPVFHTRYPADKDVLRVQVTPRQGSHMETLAFYFPVVVGNHAELVLHWGTTVVPLSIDVP